jgi:M6 family metalloprotease-like protein
MLFNAASKDSLTSYYKDISRNALTVNGKAVGWYKAPKNDTYYENGQQGGGTRMSRW